MKIAIIGNEGFLGSTLHELLKIKHDVCGIVRSNYAAMKGKAFDVLINANGNSKRYWANNNPYEDFEASTISVYKTLLDFKFGIYLYISSSDVYVDHNDVMATVENADIFPEKLCPYGFHKFLSELIVKKYSQKYIILRISAMVGENLKKGPIRDAIDGKPLFITLDSSIQFISTSAVCDVIIKILEKNVYNEIFNVGGEGVFHFRDLEIFLKKKPEVQRDAEKQTYNININKLKNIFLLKRSEDYVSEYLDSQKWKKGGIK